MKTIDLRRQDVGLDELLIFADDDLLHITSRDGRAYLLESADAFDREIAALGHDPDFRSFLSARAAQPGRTPLEDVEARLGSADDGSA